MIRQPALLLLALLAACGAARVAGPGPALVDLTGSLAPLHAWFDAHAGEPRAILLLSPV
jgi:hypothetical protein